MGDYNNMGGFIEVPLPEGEGQLFLASKVKQKVKRAFENWLEGRARKRVFQLRQSEEIDEMEYKEAQKSVSECSASGVFSWGGDAMQQAIRQIPGMVEMIRLLAWSAGTKGEPNPNGEEPITASRIMELFNKGVRFGEYIQQIIDASPNFLHPPIPGEED